MIFVLKFLNVQYKGLVPTEKSGPCPDLGAESNTGNVPDNKIVESESKVDKSSETSPVHSASPSGFETIDPFGSTIK